MQVLASSQRCAALPAVAPARRPSRALPAVPFGACAPSTSSPQQPWNQARASSLVARSAQRETDPELMTEAERKKAEADKLRAAEKFMVIGSGQATCKGCGYEYNPDKGDPEFPVPPGVKFESTPDDYCCPVCGAPKDKFESRIKVVAGFAENQRYGLGGNSMTEAQKSLLIYGTMGIFFLLFISGYALQ